MTRSSLRPNVDQLVRASWTTGVVLILTDVAGGVAAFALTLDELEVARNPKAILSCSINVFVQCGANLASWQGHVFGFPNPLIGLMAFPIVVAVGVGTILGLRAGRVFWWLFNLGMFFGLVFVAWLVTQSIFALNTLCPWCCLVYLAVIPMSLVVTLDVCRLIGGNRLATLGSALYRWTPAITALALTAIFLVAQVRLGVVQSLLQ